jgi:flagellar basal body-associated protein FliL
MTRSILIILIIFMGMAGAVIGQFIFYVIEGDSNSTDTNTIKVYQYARITGAYDNKPVKLEVYKYRGRKDDYIVLPTEIVENKNGDNNDE